MKKYLNIVLGKIRPWKTGGGKGLRGRRPSRLLVVAWFGGGVAIEVVGLAGFYLTRLLCLSKLFILLAFLGSF